MHTFKRSVYFLPVLAVWFLFGCATPLPPGTIKGPSTFFHRMDLETGGYQRAYRVHVPAAYDGQRRLPLVVVVHGAFDTAKGIEKISGFSRLANEENFIVLYPEGIGIFGYLQHWNAGHCCGKAADDQIDDVGYLAAAIDDVTARLAVDRQRVYMVGFSNGGMMTYRFAAAHSRMLAAAAPMAASIGGRPDADAPQWRIPTPETPLPLLVVHGLDDDDVRFDGGRSMHRKGERTYYPVATSVQFWVEANGCVGPPTDRPLAGGAVQFRSWDTCKNDAVTALCTIEGWGHTWPGPYFTAQFPTDDPLYHFDAARLVWDFFKRFP